jgi:hypothetical protein
MDQALHVRRKKAHCLFDTKRDTMCLMRSKPDVSEVKNKPSQHTKISQNQQSMEISEMPYRKPHPMINLADAKK